MPIVAHQRSNKDHLSKLKLLVPTIGTFFTPLLLHDAFVYQDRRRYISSRRFVPPSFNDIRLTLNTAQAMSLVKGGPLQLVTFDGDVTLYDDGESLTHDNPAIPRILGLLRDGVKIGIVTAAGYTEAQKYYARLYGLLDAIHDDTKLPAELKNDLIVMGGESNYLFRYCDGSPYKLEFIPREEWALEEMHAWKDEDIAGRLRPRMLKLRRTDIA